MIYFNKKNISILSLFTLSVVILLYNIADKGVQVNQRCPIRIQPDYINHYQDFINSESEYIAYKVFSNYTYQFVALVKNNNEYLLFASGDGFPERPVTIKKIDKSVGENMFKYSLSVSRQMPTNDDALHPACLLVGSKIGQDLHVAGFFYSDLGLYYPSDPDTKGQQIHYYLNKLYDKEFELEIQKLKRSHEKKPKNEPEWVSDITELIGTKEERDVYMRKLTKNPFFELINQE